MTTSRKGYIPTLDGWRAIAVLAVLVDHTAEYQLHKHNGTLFALTHIGANGVSLFFAISGFLICSRLLEEQSVSGGISLKGFYIRRASRILPAASTYLFFVALLGMMGFIAVDRRELLASALFWRNYLPPAWIHNGWGGYTIHYWSLAVEEHFYMLWPALLAISGKRRTTVLAIFLTIVIAAWRWWDVHHQWVVRFLPGLIFPSRTDVRLDGLFLGCLVALLLDHPRLHGLFVRYYTFIPWSLCGIAYCLFTIIPRQHLYTVWESLLLQLMVAGTAVHPLSFVSRILETRYLRWIGRLSYSLYLWQQLFALSDAHGLFRISQVFPLNLGFTFLFAFLSYELVERPLIRLGHRLAPPTSPGRIDLGRQTPDQLLKGFTVDATAKGTGCEVTSHNPSRI